MKHSQTLVDIETPSMEMPGNINALHLFSILLPLRGPGPQYRVIQTLGQLHNILRKLIVHRIEILTTQVSHLQISSTSSPKCWQ